jgi:hypothetical protein
MGGGENMKINGYTIQPGANLEGANLAGANLAGANLEGANLEGANLTRAELPAPTMVLLARWRNVSDELCSDLMRWDAANHPDPTAFDAWAKGGPCPYDGVKIARACNFKERKNLWTPGPAKRPFELMVALIRERCADSDYHDKKEVSDG